MLNQYDLGRPSTLSPMSEGINKSAKEQIVFVVMYSQLRIISLLTGASLGNIASLKYLST